jgi:ankyrin repeat protein
MPHPFASRRPAEVINRHLCAVVSALLFLWAGYEPASAAIIYRWTTPEGVVFLTDDENLTPNRAGVKPSPGPQPSSSGSAATMGKPSLSVPIAGRRAAAAPRSSLMTAPTVSPSKETAKVDANGHDKARWEAHIRSLNAQPVASASIDPRLMGERLKAVNVTVRPVNASSLTDELFARALQGDMATIELMLAARTNPNASDKNGWTALMNASKYGQALTVTTLLARGAHVDTTDIFGETALMAAVTNGHTDIAQILLDHGAKVNANANGETVLMQAAQYGYADTAEFLLTHGADVNAKGYLDQTALMVAANYGHADTVQTLLAHGADVNAKARGDMTALMFAARGGSTAIVTALLAQGADVNAKDHSGRTALMVAAVGGHAPTISALLAHGADANVTDMLGQTALIDAERNGHTPVVDLLQGTGAKNEIFLLHAPQKTRPID